MPALSMRRIAPFSAFFLALLALLAPHASAATNLPVGTQAPNGFMSSKTTVTTSVNSGAGVKVPTVITPDGAIYFIEATTPTVKRAVRGVGGYTLSTPSLFPSGKTPVALAADKNGVVYVAYLDSTAVPNAYSISKNTPDGAGGFTASTISLPTIKTPGGNIKAMSVDINLNIWLVATPQFSTSPSILELTPSGGSYSSSTITTYCNTEVSSIAADSVGNVYFVDPILPAPGGSGVRKLKAAPTGFCTNIDAADTYATIPGASTISIDANDKLYVSFYDSSSDQGYIGRLGDIASPSTPTVLAAGLNSYAPSFAANIYGTAFAAGLSSASGTESSVSRFDLNYANFGNVAVGTGGPVTASIFFGFGDQKTLSASTPFQVQLGTSGAGTDYAPTTGGAKCVDAFYAANTYCTFDITLQPTAPGLRLGALTLNNVDNSPLYSAALSATGIAPLAGFSYTATNETNNGTPSSVSLGALATDSSGELFGYVVTSAKILKANLGTANPPDVVASGLTAVTGVAVGGDGSVYYVDSGVLRIAPYYAAAYHGTSIHGGTTLTGVTVDATGNVYVASTDNTVQKAVRAGLGFDFTTVATGLNGPQAIAAAADGSLYVADTGAQRIAKLTPNGTGTFDVTTALAGSIGPVSTVAVDLNGNLYYIDPSFTGAKIARKGAGGNYSVEPISTFDTDTNLAVDNSGRVYVGANPGDIIQYDPTQAPSLSFALTGIGHTSSDSPKTVTFRNLGNAALSLPAGANTNPLITVSGYSRSYLGNDCPNVQPADSAGTLAANSSCSVYISFQPTIEGPNQSGLFFTDNSLNASPANQLVNLNGAGAIVPTKLAIVSTAPHITAGGNLGSIHVEERNNSNVLVSATDTITLTIKDSNNGTFYTSSTAAVAGSATFNTSATAATLSGTYTITATASGLNDGTQNALVDAGVVASLVADPTSTPQSTFVSTAFANPLTVTAKDTYNNVVSGATVSFTAQTVPGPSAVLSLDSVVTGTNGKASITATANGNAGGHIVRATSNAKTALFNLTNEPGVTVSGSLAGMTAGQSFSTTLSSANGTGPYTYAVDSGVLAAGLSLNGSGVLSGTPTYAGMLTVVIRSTDSTPGTHLVGTQSFTYTVAPPAITVGPATLPVGRISKAYSQTVTASGGTAPYTFTVSVGTLPPGLALNATTGAVSGTPTAAGLSSFTIAARDSTTGPASPFSGSKSYTNLQMQDNPTITATALTGGTVGVTYTTTLAASGGTGPYTYALSGAGPDGLLLNATTGVLSGTPTKANNYSFTVNVTDTATPTVTVPVTLTLKIVKGTATVNVADATVTYDGAAHTLIITTVPVGLSTTVTYNSSSITPTQAATYAVVATVNDDNYTGSGSGTLKITPAPATINVTSPTVNYDGSPHDVGVTTSPLGLATLVTYNDNPSLPSSAGTYAVKAQITDKNYSATPATGTVTINTISPTISFTIANHTFGDAAFAVSATSNSSGAITYSIASGPATILGSTVTLTGPGTVVVHAAQVANGNYAAGSQDATFTVAATAPTITFTIPNHTFGDAAFSVAATSNSSGAITYTIASGPATVTGSTVTLTGAGTVVVHAAQAANGNYAAGTKDANITVGKATPTIIWPQPIAVASGTTLSAAQLNATATGVGGGSLAGNFVYTPATGASLTLGANALSVTFTPTNTADYNNATANNSVTVVAAATSTTLTASLNPAPQGVSVTFTATIGGGGASPGGSVTFSEGATTLATVAVTGTTATYSTSALSAGAHSLTATYTGTLNFTGSTGTLSETISPFTVTATGGGNSVSVSANSGDAATASLSIADGNAFTGTVTFSCTGLPANTTCTFNPPTINVVPGGPAQTVTLTISTSGTAELHPLTPLGGSHSTVTLASTFILSSLLLLGLGIRGRRTLGKNRLTLLALILLSITGAGALQGCGGNASSGSSKTAPGTYNFNVVATSGSNTQTIPVTFVVH